MTESLRWIGSRLSLLWLLRRVLHGFYGTVMRFQSWASTGLLLGSDSEKNGASRSKDGCTSWPAKTGTLKQEGQVQLDKRRNWHTDPIALSLGKKMMTGDAELMRGSGVVGESPSIAGDASLGGVLDASVDELADPRLNDDEVSDEPSSGIISVSN